MLATWGSSSGLNALLASSSLSLNFSNGSYTLGGVPYAVASVPGYSFTRASGGYAQNVDGSLTYFASGVPRITNKGYLSEESRTNIIYPSSPTTLPGGTNAWNPSWNGAASTIVANDRIAPDGTLTASKITTTGASEGVYYRSNTLPAANANWTSSIWVYATSAITFSQNINSSLGTAWTNVSDATTAVPANVWTRLTLTRTAAAVITAASVTYAIFVPTSGTSFWIWGAQSEAGAFATSYIPTTTAAATRAADNLYYLNTASGWPYTMSVQANVTANGGANRQMLSLGSQRGDLYLTGGDTPYLAIANVANIASGTAPDLSNIKAAATLYSSYQALSVNGGAVGKGTNATADGSNRNVYIGVSAAPSERLNGYVKSAAIYPTAFTDAQLQAITA